MEVITTAEGVAETGETENGETEAGEKETPQTADENEVEQEEEDVQEEDAQEEDAQEEEAQEEDESDNDKEIEPTDEQIDLQSTIPGKVTSSPDKVHQSTNSGVLLNSQGKKTKRRCRCIQKKQRRVLKEITYIPLQPVVQQQGKHKGFTCNCSHLKKVTRSTRSSTMTTRRPRESWG